MTVNPIRRYNSDEGTTVMKVQQHVKHTQETSEGVSVITNNFFLFEFMSVRVLLVLTRSKRETKFLV